MFVSELYKIMVNKVAFVGFRGRDRLNRPPLDPPLTESMQSEHDTILPYVSELMA